LQEAHPLVTSEPANPSSIRAARTMTHLVITIKTAAVRRKDMYDMPKDGFD